MKVAVVGFGGAGQSIAQAFYEKYSSIADVYAVGDEKHFDIRFFGFDEFEELVKILLDYDHVILTSGLGGRGGDYLVRLAERLNNQSVFVCKPFKAESYRAAKTDEQLKKLGRNAFVRELDELIKRMPDATISDALITFDSEMAEKIAESIKKIEGGVVESL